MFVVANLSSSSFDLKSWHENDQLITLTLLVTASAGSKELFHTWLPPGRSIPSCTGNSPITQVFASVQLRSRLGTRFVLLATQAVFDEIFQARAGREAAEAVAGPGAKPRTGTNGLS